jgi:hypothetical protein
MPARRPLAIAERDRAVLRGWADAPGRRSPSATACARWVAAELGVSVVTVGRAWRAARVNLAASGAVVFEADPPLPVTACELAGLCVHGASAIALLRRVPAAGPQAPPVRVRPPGPAPAGPRARRAARRPAGRTAGGRPRWRPCAAC